LGFKIVPRKGIALLQGEIIAKSKNTMKFLKIFSRTKKPKSIKLVINYAWVK
jgi:hypothetical protein